MSLRPKGKRVSIDPANPEALGICDYTGFVHLRRDLVQQMQYRGNGLVWTGLYVGKDFADVPNEQERPPILPPDPVPIQWPRVQEEQNITWNAGLGITWNNLNMLFFNSWGTYQDGSQAQSPAVNLAQLQNYNWGP
jgi:hypothetical protein